MLDYNILYFYEGEINTILEELDFLLRNRAPIVEKSIQIILMMENTVNSSVKYIMLKFKVFYAIM